MLRRTLILTLCLAATLAVVGVTGASAKDGAKFEFTLPAIPGLTVEPIDFACSVTVDPSDGTSVKLYCHNHHGPYSGAPKDQKTFKFRFDGARFVLNAYPDGQITAVVYGAVL